MEKRSFALSATNGCSARGSPRFPCHAVSCRGMRIDAPQPRYRTLQQLTTLVKEMEEENEHDDLCSWISYGDTNC